MPESEQITFTTQATLGDVVWSSVTLARSSVGAVAIGAFSLVTATVGALLLADIWVVPIAIFGVSLVTGLFSAPFAWISVRNNRKAQLSVTEVTADASGITLQSRGSSSSSEWASYRRVSETGRAFLLDPGTGLVLIVPKRGVAEPILTAFRRFMADAGLLNRSSRRQRTLRWLTGVAVGIGFMVGLTAAIWGFNALQSNVHVALDVTVDDGAATVAGSTDLPDGSLVTVRVYQADEWRRAGAEGRSEQTFPWIRDQDVTVDDGSFIATFDISGWPSGSGAAMALFWVDPAQPDSVRERFGNDGENLRGIGVGKFEDGTPRFRAHFTFAIP